MCRLVGKYIICSLLNSLISVHYVFLLNSDDELLGNSFYIEDAIECDMCVSIIISVSPTVNWEING